MENKYEGRGRLLNYMRNISSIIKRLVYPYGLNSDAERLISLRHKLVRGGVKPLNILKRRLYDKICMRNHAFIPLTANIGDGVVFPHGICGIFISQGAIIGNNVVIFHQVTIGSNTLKDSNNYGAPTVGDNVYIGAGAKIIGNVHVGNNVRIGANAVVTKDIPDNATVVLDCPRIIMHNTPKNNTFEIFVSLDAKKEEFISH